MESENTEFPFMAAKISVIGPTLSYPQYLRSAQGRFPLPSRQRNRGPVESSAVSALGNTHSNSKESNVRRGKLNLIFCN